MQRIGDSNQTDSYSYVWETRGHTPSTGLKCLLEAGLNQQVRCGGKYGGADDRYDPVYASG